VRTVILAAAFITIGAMTTPPSPAREIVEIRVRGHYFSAPATVPITVAVEPGAQNRMLIVEADSEDYFRSSGVELAGENEKRLHSVEFKSLPAGEYTIRAEVRSKSDVLGSAVGGLVVTGTTPEP
jgi:hypothetical protein